MQSGTVSVSSWRRTGIRVVVAGDRSTGKTSLVAAVATGSIPEDIPPVFPVTTLPVDEFEDRVPVTIVDASASFENRANLVEELKRADVVVLTYACDQPLSFTRLSSFWLEELRRLQLNVPVIVAGCKLDLRDENEEVTLEETAGPMMKQYSEIEICIECSALTMTQVSDIFYFAQKAVLHPTAPLYDHESRTLKPRCVRALKRIFALNDRDMDGALNDSELNDFQMNCFNTSLEAADIASVKKLVTEKQSDGLNDAGLTFEGFLFLQSLFIGRGRLDSVWAVLRKYGYDDELKLRDDLLPVPQIQSPDQSIELTRETVSFLRGVFRSFAANDHGGLQPAALDDIFSTAPESPWSEPPYRNAAEHNSAGNLTLNGFLSLWSMMTLLKPRESLANLIYVGYPGNPGSALSATRRRSVDRKKKKSSDRNVFLCHVFGPRNSGKSALLNSFLDRHFLENYKSAPDHAAKIWDQVGGNSKTLVLHEVREDEIHKMLEERNSLAACDVAIFVYDCSDEKSWKKTSEILIAVAKHGEESSFSVPCLIVAAKYDLNPHPTAIHASAKVCLELGIDVPIPVSSKQGEFNNLFGRILNAAMNPHVGIPETENCRRKKDLSKIIGNSLVFMSVGAAFAVVGVAAFRAVSARRTS